MPKLSGIFEQFYNLDTIPLNEISPWVKKGIDEFTLQNFIGNRILYPQTVPVSKKDLEIDLAIFKALIKRQPEKIINFELKKITVPVEFEKRFGNLERLISAVIEVFSPEGVTTIFRLEGGKEKIVGSIVSPSMLNKNDSMAVCVDGKEVKLPSGKLSIIRVNKDSVSLKLENNTQVSVKGGVLGVVIDLRKGGSNV